MSEWINVDDRMPEEGTYVFGAVYGTDVVIRHEGESMRDAIIRSTVSHPRVKICQWCGNEEGWYSDFGMMVVTPRFWMTIDKPLPPIITAEDVFGKEIADGR